MEKRMEDLLPLLAVEHNCIVSRQGDITVAFKVQLPELFSLSSEEYETLHQAWVKAIRILPKFTVFHKQDWFLQSRYQPAAMEHRDFLHKAADQYFSGRNYLNHSCYVYLTKKPDGRRVSSSLFSNLTRRNLVPEQTINPAMLQQFLSACSQFRHLLADSGYMKLEQLSNRALSSDKGTKGIVERYCQLSENPDQPMISDIKFEPEIAVGNKKCQLYTLSDADDLPALCGSRISYEKYSTDKTKFSIGFASALGQLLPCDHLYNQYIFIDDAQQTIKRLEQKKLRLQSLAAYSRENALSRDAVNDFLNEAISAQRLPVKAHFNVLAWTEDKEQIKEIRNQVGTAFAQMDAIAKEETVGAPQIFWAGIPGNSADFPMNDCFDTFLEQATCFIASEGCPASASPAEGIRFCDRLSSRPLYIDLYDGPRKAGITSNMGTLVCGTSGGGKSMTVNHILHSLYTQGAHCVTVDIGGSYLGLCESLGGYYFSYSEESPIKFNPFYLADGTLLDTEKTESLKSLLVALWKQEHDSFNRSEYVALSNALSGYYKHLNDNAAIFPCFNSFYEYLETDYVEVLKGHKVKDRDFDVDNFLYVLRPFYKGGEFDYLLNATENLDLLHQPFIVIELDNIKDHPILFPVVTLVIMELFISKMRKLKGVRKVLTIDEAWKAIAKSGMAEFLKYAFKTIRKFNGIPIVITQELDDLVSSPIIKDAIINNADIKILMDMRKFINKFDKLQDTLGMSEKGKTILLSVNKDEREIYIDIGGQLQAVYRNELCPEEYYAFTTEGKERVKVLEYAQKYGGMEAGITQLIKDLQTNK
ncbi:TraG family conjugative transposon ATPase [Mucilaginibacter boryungensis]|uniref:TraG family conjugative transposon ATPase n=1 Tax=Mucilaginibacter boryungensis TaxID=768480 RepID=A0ABR9XLP1_9SPHI|nr:TraG family conjugative transposon ATPase [Mucilaginibacter boryungensis]MBE9668150.1 TraG family conjugative transposon ATPase [Mucilaginibacter boryungensis]